MNKNNEKITALTQQQFLIKRINIYFGRELGDADSPYSTQKSIALREIQDNSIDAIRKTGKPGTIKTTFNEDYSFECYDNGPGIPIDISKTAEGKPASSVYLALGVLNAGSNYENVTDSLGTNGVGGSGAQMLSEYTKVEIYRNKKKYRLDFKDGKPGIFEKDGSFSPTKDLTFLKEEKDDRSSEEKKLFPTGTKIKIKLNDDLFKSKYPYNADDLIERLKGVAFLVPSLKIEITNKLRKLADGSYQTEVFHSENGIEQLLDLNITNKMFPISTIQKYGKFQEASVDISDGKAITKTIEKEIGVEVAFTYCNNYDYFIDSYVNTIKTRLHGFHVQAFEKALVTVFNAKFRSMRSGLSKNDEDPIFQDYSEGLAAVVSVKIPEPEFTNQIKEELGGKKALKEFTKLFSDELENWVNSSKNQNQLKIIAEKVISASKNRIRARELQEIKREKNKLERSTTMPSKLVDCEITHSPYSELFIAEGDSAISGLKSARDSKYQALFPIRGKIMNALKASPKEILQNEEIQNIAKCLDAGIGDDYNHANARYNKIFIATDADPDGAAIGNLLLVVFWELFPQVVRQGCLYKILTPLYEIRTKKQNYYALNPAEKDEILNMLESKKIQIVEIVRMKGLGEGSPNCLYETGMNPQTRRFQQIAIGDIEKAQSMLMTVMGKDVEPRKKWLEENPLIDEEEIGELDNE